jgi:hypothetical protein
VCGRGESCRAGRSLSAKQQIGDLSEVDCVGLLDQCGERDILILPVVSFELALRYDLETCDH